MTTKELTSLAAQRADITQAEASILMQALCKKISASLSEGTTVHVRGFGDFEPRERKQRIMVHPMTGVKTLIPQKRQVVFRQTTNLKEELK